MIIKQNGYDVEYSDDGKMLVKCPPSFSGEFVVPDSMTEIGFIAFYGCTGLKAIEFH